jgi:hypothetical protein
MSASAPCARAVRTSLCRWACTRATRPSDPRQRSRQTSLHGSRRNGLMRTEPDWTRSQPPRSASQPPKRIKRPGERQGRLSAGICTISQLS